MRVERFTDEYSLLAPLYEMSADQLRDRDERSGQEVQRWYVVEGGLATAAATARLRPDDRLFLVFRGNGVDAYGPLTEHVVGALGRSAFTTCEDAESDRLRSLFDGGFQIEMTNDRFVVPFDVVLRRLDRAWLPNGYAIRSVADVDEDRAFRLDNAVRNLVPGSEGWAGNRQWFAEELRSPEFDPTTYLVAIEESTDSYAGLLRIWRNADGPRLGLLAVLPEHRVRSLAAALLKQGLIAAAEWGFDAFATETSPQNPDTYPGLMRMGIEPIGRFHQLRHPGPA